MVFVCDNIMLRLYRVSCCFFLDAKEGMAGLM